MERCSALQCGSSQNYRTADCLVTRLACPAAIQLTELWLDALPLSGDPMQSYQAINQVQMT